MQNTLSDSEYIEPKSSQLVDDDDDDFKPIDLNWRKKYYKKAFVKRVIAIVLDAFTTFMLSFIPFLFIDFPENYFWAALILQNSLNFVIHGIMESSKWQGSFGKRIMKIEVSDDYGNAISFWRSIGRNFLKLITHYSYCLIIPLIIQIFTYRKSGKLFHDYFSKTIIGERINVFKLPDKV